MAAGATWPWRAALPFSSSGFCGLLNDLLRKHSYPKFEEHNRWLPRYLAIYNRLRKHSGLGWRSPLQRLTELLC